MSSTRRSSRANKGQHTKREVQSYSDEEEQTSQRKRLLGISSQDSKRPHLQDDEDDDYQEEGEDKKDEEVDGDVDGDGDGDGDGDVRCTPCGTTSENYDEDADEGGIMIECESCKTWQHAKCMGFKSTKVIPKHYKCNICNASVNIKIDSYSIGENLKDKTRVSVAKAFFNVFKRNIPESYKAPEGLDQEKLSSEWAMKLENVVFEWCPKKDKRYTDKSRSLMVLIKKPNVMNRIIDGELSFTKLVNSSPEEIDDELKEYAEKVRSESIRRSVLTVDENQGQRIRRTHKGEEIVEDANGQQEDVDINIMTRNIDHRRFEDEDAAKEVIVNDNDKVAYNNYNPSRQDEDEEEGGNSSGGELSTNGGNESDSSEVDDIPDLDDKELDMIIKGKKRTTEPVKQEETKRIPELKIPSISPSRVWTGRITFPDFASFGALGEFYTCTNYTEPSSEQTAKFHNRYIKISKEILSKDHYEVEGRLDKTRADAYLNKIVSTRDQVLIEIKCTENQNEYDKLYRYLVERNKVGVLSGKPAFVKDAYLLGIDGNDSNLPDYLKSLHKMTGKVGLFALYIVKKDYIPTGPSILKKSTPSSQYNTNNGSSQEKEKAPLLDSILNKLGGSGNQENVQDRSHQPQYPVAQSGLPANLTADQLTYLSGLVQQNPHVQQNPNALLQLLQQKKGTDYSSFR